eukprot:Awhi_evm1s7351
MVGKVFGGVITGKHKPTKAHMLIKQLQDCHALLRVYTQNIDMLESAAGVLPENIIEENVTSNFIPFTVLIFVPREVE